MINIPKESFENTKVLKATIDIEIPLKGSTQTEEDAIELLNYLIWEINNAFDNIRSNTVLSKEFVEVKKNGDEFYGE